MSSSSDQEKFALLLALLGGILMLAIPFNETVYSRPPCIIGDPCSIPPPAWVSALQLADTLLFLSSGAGTIIAALTFRILGRKQPHSFGVVLVALSMTYVVGLGGSVIASTASNLTFGLPEIILTASIGPILVFLSGFLLVRTKRIS